MADEADIDAQAARLTRLQERDSLLLQINALQERALAAEARLEAQFKDSENLDVPNGCPFYKDGQICNGTVRFNIHDTYGTCQKCGAEVALDGYWG